MSPQSIQAFWNDKLQVHLAVRPDKCSWKQASGPSVGVSDYCRGLSNSTSDRTSPSVTPVCRFQKQLPHWRHTADCATHLSINASLGVTASLCNTSLTGNLAINSTPLASCAVWGPPVCRKCRRCNRRRCTKRICCWCDPVLLRKLISGRQVHGVRRGGTIVSVVDLLMMHCGRRWIAGKDGRLEWTLEKELKRKGLNQRQNNKLICVLLHTLPENDLAAFEYSHFTKDTFSFKRHSLLW